MIPCDIPHPHATTNHVADQSYPPYYVYVINYSYDTADRDFIDAIERMEKAVRDEINLLKKIPVRKKLQYLPNPQKSSNITKQVGRKIICCGRIKKDKKKRLSKEQRFLKGRKWK